MSEPTCFEPGDAARVADLPLDDPLRTHARDCPRCAALLDAYAAFMAADPGAVPAHELADARTRLARALSQEAARGPGAARRPWRERLQVPSLRPLWGTAAVVIAAVALWVWVQPPAPRGGPVLRGEPAATVPTIERAEWSGDTLRLAWRGMPGADGFRLRFYSAAFAEMGTAGPFRDSSVALGGPALPGHGAAGDTLVVRVEALRDGDPLASSAARLLARH